MSERQAVCCYAGAYVGQTDDARHTGRYPGSSKPQESGRHLPFFEARPNETYDRYYCGCYGWD